MVGLAAKRLNSEDSRDALSARKSDRVREEKARELLSMIYDLENTPEHIRDNAKLVAAKRGYIALTGDKKALKDERTPVGQPFAAISNGKPVFAQRYSDGSVIQVDGYQPMPSRGSESALDYGNSAGSEVRFPPAEYPDAKWDSQRGVFTVTRDGKTYVVAD